MGGSYQWISILKFDDGTFRLYRMRQNHSHPGFKIMAQGLIFLNKELNILNVKNYLLGKICYTHG